MSALLTAESLRTTVESHVPAVHEALLAHVDQARTGMPVAAPDYAQLWDYLGAQFHGGKNLRPTLTLAAYLGLGGDDPDAVIPVAAAMEMLHTAMLVHDDILDHDEVRRGKPNIAGLRRAELRAAGHSPDKVDDQVLAAALLGGDLALSSSYDLILRSNLPAHHRVACMELITRAIRSTIAGELLDVYGDLTPVEQADPLLVSALKTAWYSCVVPLLAGATLAGADPTMLGHLERLGLALGVSFQLIDDDLGVFGTSEVTGKSTLTDLRAGKRTELIRLGFERADAAQTAVLERHLGDPELDEAGAAQVRDVLVQTGAREAALRLSRRRAREATRIAAERIPAPLSGYLVGFIAALQGRVS
ncbi:polyprenyl synthetase family protein [Demequina sp. B12]|uniref:polyprenyl synthetase family protein n=1 Tax=Demequina sp. B12 TaxID=2992757 RepID=UPI00237B17A7|nr:polyprenyl synthetase family protein [Demequina sp. B12]MDE0572098.1 polyprenyl synthetase family protein [Demequina sp. B12]